MTPILAAGSVHHGKDLIATLCKSEDLTYFHCATGALHISVSVGITGTDRLDDDRAYLSLDNRTFDQIAELVADRLNADRQERSKVGRRQSTVSTRTVAILSDDEKHILGIIVVSRLPLPLELYKRLFTQFDWTRHLRTLIRYALVRKEQGALRPTSEAVKALRSDLARYKACTEQWVKRLEELKDHSDIALYLAPHYMSEGRWDDAIAALADVANNGLNGHLNETYHHILEKLTHRKLLRRLEPVSRIKLFHALAICATQLDRCS
jgi:hypothetical protein